MCGIAGYFGAGNRETLECMGNTLHHRGPDDDGFYVDEKVGLAHRRLSIIDLSPAGKQPVVNEAGNVQVVFNGEIYNFKELRAGLKNSHTFRGNSDTEVIVHLYEEIGLEVFSHLEGMFAIAIYDKKRGELILARDRMGKKPLYWRAGSGTLIFGSELKALMQHPSFKKEIDIASLEKYLQYEYVPTPHTIFKDTYKLEPGHYLRFSGDGAVKVKFWDIKFNEQKISLDDAMTGLDARLAAATADRLVSDVPLGIFLSGGLDSSTVAYYAQKSSVQKIKTFSIGFEDASFDESSYAKEVAAHLGTEHHELILGPERSLELVSVIADLLDEPMADSSIIPTYLLSRFTREYVTVALGGDGGDELFCGYDTFAAHKLAEIYGKIPLPLRRYIIEPILRLLPVSHSNMSFDFKAKKFISGFYGEQRYRNQRWLGAFDVIERKKLMRPAVCEGIEDLKVFEDIDTYLGSFKDSDSYHQLGLTYQRTYMMDQILVKVDRASMMNSLEVRAPFLDTRVVEFANSLPTNLKLHGFTTKYVLKKLMEPRLPKGIASRKKKGFGVPIGAWLQGPLKLLTTELFSNELLNRQGLFDSGYVHQLLDNHFSGRKDNRKQIWTLLVFQMWWSRWMQ